MKFSYTNAFESATIVLPVVSETYSLVETVNLILQTSKAEVRELLVVICDKTTPESMATIKNLSARLGDLIVVHHQKLKFLGGAMREAFEVARGSHTIMMASDLETDPALLPRLIAMARAHPAAIVTVTRWHAQGGF
jgi:GT2 family glycosyltransferase